jgi:hypothetical protein
MTCDIYVMMHLAMDVDLSVFEKERKVSSI